MNTRKFLFSNLLIIICVGCIYGTGFAGKSRAYSEYPTTFDGFGKVDMYKGGRYISINDRSFEITEKTTFNRPGNLNCSKGWLRENDMVYYMTESGSKKIVSLWLVKDKYMGRGAP